jgi:XRE family transcriptional regulator, regulator of sulfur utilization
MSPTPRQLGQRLATRRKALELSRYSLAKQLGVSRDYLGKVERGQASPTVAMLQRIAKALGVKPGRLLD